MKKWMKILIPVAAVVLIAVIVLLIVLIPSREEPEPEYTGDYKGASEVVKDYTEAPTESVTPPSDETPDPKEENCLHPDDKKENVTGVAPTCTEAGYKDGKRCTVCGKLFVDAIAPLGHRFVDGVCVTCGEKQALSEGLAFEKSLDGSSYVLAGVGECTDALILVPDEYEGMPVTGVADRAFFADHTVSAVLLPDSVAFIGEGAFAYCGQLTRVTAGKGLKTIGDGAFESCRYLTDFSFVSGLETVGKKAFAFCGALKEATLPDTLKQLGEMAFYGCDDLESAATGNALALIPASCFAGCSSLKEIAIGSSVSSVGNGAFTGCEALTEVVLPDSLHDVGVSAFASCTKLASIALPSSLRSVGDSAFLNCTALSGFDLPSGVTSFGTNVFTYCERLSSITAQDGGRYSAVGNCLIEKETGTLVASCSSSMIPDDGSVKRIADYAFFGNGDLSELTLPEGVVSVGKSAFSECGSLTKVSFPESLRDLGQEAFLNCSALEEVRFAAGIRTIGFGAFKDCGEFSSIYAGTENEWKSVNVDSGNEALEAITFA